jgi:hypothetical protein
VDPRVLEFAGYYLGCLMAVGVNTQTIQQPLESVPDECSFWAIYLAIFDFATVGSANQLCLACLINGLEYLPREEASILSVLQTCGAGLGPKHGHQGVNGQLILSKYPIQQDDVVQVQFPESFMVSRVNIHATINGLRFGFGHFAFNLLQDVSGYGDLSYFMYGYGTSLQTSQAQDFIDGGVDVVVGDLNSGPIYQPAGYNLLLASGYKLASPEVATWCDEGHENFLPCKNVGASPLQIDHILVRESTTVGGSPSTFNNRPIISDHIGVSATVLGFARK